MAEQMRSNTRHNIGIARQIGNYSDAVEVPAGSRWLFISGTPGLSVIGVIPKGIEPQAEQAWENILSALKQAGMGVRDLVKICQYLSSEADVPAYVAVRNRYLGEARPASMLVVGCGMVRPVFCLEIEAIAAKSPLPERNRPRAGL